MQLSWPIEIDKITVKQIQTPKLGRFFVSHLMIISWLRFMGVLQPDLKKIIFMLHKVQNVTKSLKAAEI